MKLAALLAILIGIILVGCSNGPPTGVEQSQNIDATVAVAVAATRTANDVQEKIAATLRPFSLTLIMDKGVDYSKDGQYENAIQEFDKVIQLDPDYAVAYYNRGYSYNKLGQYQTAINDYTEAIQLNPDYADSYINRGNSYHYLGQHQTAINDYTKAIQLDPDYARAYYNRGLSYYDLGQYTLANADEAKACSLDSQYC